MIFANSICLTTIFTLFRFSLGHCPGLKSLDGVNSLQKIHGSLDVFGLIYSRKIVLSAFQNVTYIAGNIHIALSGSGGSVPPFVYFDMFLARVEEVCVCLILSLI